MLNRRRFLTNSLGVLAAAGTSLAFQGDNKVPGWGVDTRESIPDGSASKGMINQKTDQAIQRGLAYLKHRQGRDGAFGSQAYPGNVAISALGAMAFMCGGSQPNRGPYGRNVRETLKYILTKENVSGGNPGFIHNPMGNSHGPMYGHGFATLFLGEVYGMIHERSLREDTRLKLNRAVNLILKAQARNWDGAWRYKPDSTDADLSVAVCQVMALRSARNAGISVPKSAIDKCTDYVKACQERKEGFFRYTKRGPGPGPHFARTAAGVCALNAAGIYKGDEVKAGLDYLNGNKPGGGFMRGMDMHYFYGHYYAVQAMWTAGGSYWSDWYPAIRDELLSRQNTDGSWADGICYHYGTAMACIILQVPNNYLPILQK